MSKPRHTVCVTFLINSNNIFLMNHKPEDFIYSHQQIYSYPSNVFSSDK